MKTLFYRLRNRTAAFIHDLLMIPIAWFGALWLRFNLEAIPEPFVLKALSLLPLLMFVHAVMFFSFGLYRGVWRFASMPDFVRIFKAVTAAVLLCTLVIVLFGGFEATPRSWLVIHGLLLLILLGTPRFCYRWIKEHQLYYQPGARILIVGAGRAGEIMVRDLLRDPKREYQPVAFVDDDIRKIGTEVQGVRVVGRCERIPQVVVRYRIDMIFIAIPTASSAAMQRIVEYCEDSGRMFRTLPRWQDLLFGDTVLQKLRNVSIEDLLGREQVALEWGPISQALTGKTVMVSGGGGSIGSELCRQIARLQPARLVLLERGEFNLYQIDMELRSRFPGLVLHCCLGDVCDEVLVNHLMQRYRPDVVFHAAAYKHVPLLEFQVREAVRNNLLGTTNLADAADRHGCQVFVLISTDKAVNPTNIMGASKRLAEIYCQNFNLKRFSATRFVTVRFGNVLDSAGSVVPLFRRQIEAGGPVTVTHPEVMRYFMTIPEASQLIMQAGAVGQGGNIFVLDMGKPININYLAEQMILLSGKQPGRDILIEFTGLRPGEKLYEELFHEAENLLPTPYPKLLLAQHRRVDWARFVETLEFLRRACDRYDEPRILEMVKLLVPELQQTVPPVTAPPVGQALKAVGRFH
ncbi:MAG: nucleoside-diphosphate sugar epimerase/dehydratase [Candidatus Competibacteraceae bacterium]|nr:nucleoside-diphosphate sugar epimerase/dehydratase [Candidatus Competibacteraceae bacterium]